MSERELVVVQGITVFVVFLLGVALGAAL